MSQKTVLHDGWSGVLHTFYDPHLGVYHRRSESCCVYTNEVEG